MVVDSTPVKNLEYCEADKCTSTCQQRNLIIIQNGSVPRRQLAIRHELEQDDSLVR